MEFWKMNGAGNDFIFLNNFKEHLAAEDLPELAKRLCERHFGIGADGLIVVDAADGTCADDMTAAGAAGGSVTGDVTAADAAGGSVTGDVTAADTAGRSVTDMTGNVQTASNPNLRRADYKMRFYNADGSEGEMCGNGARCVCRFGYENGLAGETQTVETLAGIVTGERISENQYRIRLNYPEVLKPDYPVTLDGTEYPCAYVELGNPGIPHAVIPYPDLEKVSEDAMRETARKLRFHPAFPKGANINFYDMAEDGSIFERTFERGVEDFTYACGTGTGSLVVALAAQGKTDGRNVSVRMRGGVLEINWDGKDLYLTGPADIVCTGSIV